MTEQSSAVEGDEQLKADLAAEEAAKAAAAAKEEADNKANAEDEDAGAASKKGAEENPDIDNPDIPVRSSLSHIIARKNKQIEKLRSKSEDEVEQADEADDGDVDVLTPEIRDAVNKEVERRMAPLTDTLVERTDEEELSALFAQEPKAKSYEKRIRAYMKHDSWKEVPPVAIFRYLAFPDAAEIGAKRKKVADTEAAQTRSAGTSRRPMPGSESGLPSAEEINAMSDEDLETLRNKVMSGEFAK